MKKILVIHGPNLSTLGTREPNLYGITTLDEINTKLRSQAAAAGATLTAFQSNSESELITAIENAVLQQTQYLLINFAAFTHTSIALRDALLAAAIPFIEIHLSNIYKREPFRHQSYFSDIAEGVICGLGVTSYQLGLQAILTT